ncbi:MAG: hypothetical protein HYY29_02160 [Chloroflexi bacterium]|nr:hypothetical protein [Chloroflexota bacterium]
MSRGERGVGVLELQVAIAIAALIAIGATIATWQLIKYAPASADRMTASRQIQTAAYWISRDAESAQRVTISTLTYPDFLVLGWTSYNYDGEGAVAHTVTYSFDGVYNGVGRLVRTHITSSGVDEQVTVAEHIYYDPIDLQNTSKVSFQDLKLAVKLTSRFGNTVRSREFEVGRRPNFF